MCTGKTTRPSAESLWIFNHISDSLRSSFITSLALDEEGVLMGTLDGIQKFDLESKKISRKYTQEISDSVEVYDILKINKYLIVVSSFALQILHDDGRKGKIIPLPIHPSFVKVASDTGGSGFWVAGGHLYTLFLKHVSVDGFQKSYDTSPVSHLNDAVADVFQDTTGQVYVATLSGLFSMRNNVIREEVFSEKSLRGVKSLIQSGSNVYALSTYHGLFSKNTTGIWISHGQVLEKEPQLMGKNQNGNLVLLSENEIGVANKDHWEFFKIPATIIKPPFYAMLASENSFYIASEGLILFTPKM